MRALSAANSLVQVTGSNLNLVYLVLAVSLVALAIAWALRSQVLAASAGTPKMQEIAAAVQEGAAAYLARQFKTLSYFVFIVFLLLFALPGDMDVKIGRSVFFLIGVYGIVRSLAKPINLMSTYGGLIAGFSFLLGGRNIIQKNLGHL